MASSTQQADPYARAAEKFSLACKLASIESLLEWGAQTNMPKGGTWARGEQVGALGEITSDLTGSKEIGGLLNEAQAYAGRLNDGERANLEEMRRLWAPSGSGAKGVGGRAGAHFSGVAGNLDRRQGEQRLCGFCTGIQKADGDP